MIGSTGPRWLLWVKGTLYGAVVFLMLAAHVGAQDMGDLAREATEMNPWENWQIILGFVLPLVIQLITTRIYDRQRQALAAFGVSVVVTVVGMYISGELMAGGIDVVTTPLKVLVAVIAFYKGFWEPTGVTPKSGEAARR
jgi:hypothetical protein